MKEFYDELWTAMHEHYGEAWMSLQGCQQQYILSLLQRWWTGHVVCPEKGIDHLVKAFDFTMKVQRTNMEEYSRWHIAKCN